MNTASIVAALCIAGPAFAEPPADLVAATDAWHAERIERLTAPDGWLSLVALESLSEGRNEVGRTDEHDIVYHGFPVDTVGAFLVDGDTIRFEAGGAVAIDGLPESGVIRTDAEDGTTTLTIGGIRFYVIVRGDQRFVRIKDAAAPTLVNFRGLERFPVSDAWVITAPFEPAAPSTTLRVDSVIDVEMDSEVSGYVRFEHEGVEVNAVLYTTGSDNSTLRFADATSGGSTYGAGRYLTVTHNDDGTVTLDFNRAYNPPCALTAFGTCTLPPRSNIFPFAVTAGEKWDQ